MVSRLVAVAVALATVLSAHAATPVDRIVVVVNDSIILQSELDAAMDNARQQLSQRGVRDVSRSELRDQVLERLVLQRVQMARAREAGIRVDDRELKSALSLLTDSVATGRWPVPDGPARPARATGKRVLY